MFTDRQLKCFIIEAEKFEDALSSLSQRLCVYRACCKEYQLAIVPSLNIIIKLAKFSNISIMLTGRKYLMMPSTHFICGYLASDIR